MSIFIKVNSRIKLSTYNEDSFVFVIDENRTATFYTQIPGVDLILLAFLKDGKSFDELMNENLNEKKLTRLIQFIEYLKKNNLIEFQFRLGNSETAVLCPTTHSFKDSSLSLSGFFLKQCPYTLSRFAYFRREKDEIILESPLTPFKVFFNEDSFIQLLPFIIGKMNLTKYKDNSEQNYQAKIFIKLLIEYRLIQPVNESEADHLHFWEFHDLIFHSNSRRGKLDDNASFGATYRLQKKLNAPQVFKDLSSDNVIELYKPNLETLSITDTPFTKVLEERRSIRHYNESKTINIMELGELLYRSVSIRKMTNTSNQIAIYRPYPGAGAIHEIEFYLVVNACEGLEPDIYYYHPAQHVLYRKNIDKQHIQKIILDAKLGMGSNGTNPQILFVLTSCFDKIAWKYQKMAYRSTLVSVGTIFQTISLVATSMNLASCIIGSGDSSFFSEVLEIDSLKEGAVGEFAIGTKAS